MGLSHIQSKTEEAGFLQPWLVQKAKKNSLIFKLDIFFRTIAGYFSLLFCDEKVLCIQLVKALAFIYKKSAEIKTKLDWKDCG